MQLCPVRFRYRRLKVKWVESKLSSILSSSDSIGQYAQIDLLATRTAGVTGVKTQGCAAGPCCGEKWVTQYAIQYSDDGTNWSSVTDVDGYEKVSL